MAMPNGIGIVDTMIGFPAEDFAQYDFIRDQLKDQSAEFEFPVEYMFKQVPKELYGSTEDPVKLTLNEMDRFGVELGLIGVGSEVAQRLRLVGAVELHVNLELRTGLAELRVETRVEPWQPEGRGPRRSPR